jgi:hypothetical protein
MGKCRGGWGGGGLNISDNITHSFLFKIHPEKIDGNLISVHDKNIAKCHMPPPPFDPPF